MGEAIDNKVAKKIIVDYLQAHSIRELLEKVNTHNVNCPNSCILKEDIVEILKEGDTFILLYYK